MFPTDYSVPQPHVDEWISRFDRLQEQIQEFAEEISTTENLHTDGPCGPWCGYLMRAKVSLIDATMDFQELARHRAPNDLEAVPETDPEPSA